MTLSVHSRLRLQTSLRETRRSLQSAEERITQAQEDLKSAQDSREYLLQVIDEVTADIEAGCGAVEAPSVATP